MRRPAPAALGGSHPKSQLCYHNYDNILIAQEVAVNIRPVSDLRNHYPDVEREVEQEGPVFLTKNGRGSMVVMSFEQYKSLGNTIESALDAADRQAASMQLRYTHDDVFGSVRKMLNGGLDEQAL